MSKNSPISFEFKKSFILVIIYWLLELICRLFMYINWELFQFTDNDANDEYIYLIILVLSDYLSFIVLFIHWIIKKKEKYDEEKREREKLIKLENEEENKDEIGTNITQKFEYSNKYNKSSLKRYLIPIVFGDLLSRSFIFISYKAVNLNDEEVTQKLVRDALNFFDIIFRMIFCKIFNEKNPYPEKHKKCSLILMIIVLFILGGVDIIHFIFVGHYQHPDFIYFFLILFLRSISYPFNDTIVYNYMKNNAISPFGYMRRRAFFESILLAIITPILVFCSIVHFSSDIFSYKFAIIAPLYFLTSFGKSILLLNIIYIYSSQSVSFLIISESLAGSIHEIINFIKREENMIDIKNIFLSISEIILTIFLFIITLIYGEIITINKLGLNKDQENKINKRSRNDIKKADYYNLDDEDDDDEDDEKNKLSKSIDSTDALLPR